MNNYNFEKLEGKNPSRNLSFLYFNLLQAHKDIFNKRSKELNDFKDKRIKALISIIADNDFWDKVYTPIVKDLDNLNKKMILLLIHHIYPKKKLRKRKINYLQINIFLYMGVIHIAMKF